MTNRAVAEMIVKEWERYERAETYLQEPLHPSTRERLIRRIMEGSGQVQGQVPGQVEGKQETPETLGASAHVASKKGKQQGKHEGKQK